MTRKGMNIINFLYTFMETKKCPKCQGEMEKITLGVNGNAWQRFTGATRADVGFLKIFLRNLGSVHHFRCKSCGFLESYAN